MSPCSRKTSGKEWVVLTKGQIKYLDQLSLRRNLELTSSAEEFRSAAARAFGQNEMPEFLRLYPASTDAEANQSGDALGGEMVISEQVWQWLNLQHRTGKVPVYGYKFTYTSPFAPVPSHFVEVPFVFGALTPKFIVGSKEPPGQADGDLSAMIMGYWVNFATRGDPNGPGLPYWPAYGDQDIIQIFGTAVAPEADPEAEHFRFLSKFRNAGALPAKWHQGFDGG